MKLIIQFFKCYHEYREFEFLDNNITLLCGPSGSGKTTLMDAFLWCLYKDGNPKPSNCSSNKTTFVSIVFSNWYIKRCIPNSLEVYTKDNQLLYNETAQGYIDNLFGNKDLWVSCSYIREISRNHHLLVSSDKFSILHEIAFGTDSEHNRPEFYINKCDNILTDIKRQLANKNGEHSVRYNNYINILNKNPNIKDYNCIYTLFNLKAGKIDTDIKISDLKLELDKVIKLEANIVSITDLINNINNNIRELLIPEKVDEEYLIILESKLAINKQINKLIKKKEEIGDIPDDYNELLNSARNNLIRRQNFDNKCYTYGIRPENIISELEKLQNLDYDTKVTAYNQYCLEKQTYDMTCQKIISEAKSKWEKECQQLKDQYNILLSEKIAIENNNNLLKTNYLNKDREIKLKLKYYEEKIQEYHRLTNLQLSLIENKNKIETDMSILDFNWWYSKFPNDELTLVNINNKRKQYQDLFCPHCGGSINYSNNSLHPGHFTKQEQDENLFKLTETENNLDRYLKLYKELDKINSNLKFQVPNKPEEIKEELPILNLLEVPNLNNLILPNFISPSLPNNPVIVPVPPPNPYDKIAKLKELIPDLNLDTVQNYTEIINKYQKGYELEQINIELQKYEVTNIDEKIINEYKLKIQNYRDYQTRFNCLSSQLLELKIPTTPDKSSSELKDEIKELENYLNLINKHIENMDIIEQLNAEILNINNLSNEINGLVDYEHSINYIKNCIIETSNSCLENIVNEINGITNKILEFLFDDSITVLLRTKKELKTVDKIKSVVNLQIHYDNAIYDDIRYVSKGEAQRISFALTVALSKICESPVLLLDESIDNFEVKIREKSIKVMREYLSDKIIIHASHFANIGRYDRTIDFNNKEGETYEI